MQITEKMHESLQRLTHLDNSIKPELKNKFQLLKRQWKVNWIPVKFKYQYLLPPCEALTKIHKHSLADGEDRQYFLLYQKKELVQLMMTIYKQHVEIINNITGVTFSHKNSRKQCFHNDANLS